MTTWPSPLLLDFPLDITTERLYLRALGPGDGLALLAAVEDSRQHLYPFMSIGQQVITLADAERFTQQACAAFLAREQFQMGVWRRDDDQQLAGICTLHYGDWTVPCFELGCWIRVGLASRGFATEATQAMIAFAFEKLGLVRLEIRFDHRNVPSQRVAEKLGFKQEGCLRHHNRAADGVLVDEVIYALLRSEWKTRLAI